MIDYIRGVVVEIDESRIILEVNGIGYSIFFPFRELSSIQKNEEYRVYVYKHICENGEELYGFLDRDSRKVFLALMDVNSVGPRLAFRIISSLSPQDIVRAVISGGVDSLTSIKGVSEKTAERIISELKNAIHKLGIKVEGEESNFDDLVKALRSLGYNQNEILTAINKAKQINPKLLSLDISLALQICLQVMRK
ncbi:MAG: Holliday junction branch migration protein RuvA [Brevinematales bacterium]|nr:Holliday junction branch migration protein RuvA [Brevinematales bacterium]